MRCVERVLIYFALAAFLFALVYLPGMLKRSHSGGECSIVTLERLVHNVNTTRDACLRIEERLEELCKRKEGRR